MKIVHDDGTEGEIGPGDVAAIQPGHDAWVVGDESCVSIDFGGYAQYAKPRCTHLTARDHGSPPAAGRRARQRPHPRAN
jgi:hypothetical protein